MWPVGKVSPPQWGAYRAVRWPVRGEAPRSGAVPKGWPVGLSPMSREWPAPSRAGVQPPPGVGPPRMASAGSGPVAAPPYGCGQSEAPALAIGPSPPVGAVGRLPLPVWCSQWPVGGQRGVEGAPPLRGGQWGSGSLWPPPPEKPGWGVGVGQVSRCGVVPRVGRFFLLPASLTYPSRV